MNSRSMYYLRAFPGTTRRHEAPSGFAIPRDTPRGRKISPSNLGSFINFNAQIIVLRDSSNNGSRIVSNAYICPRDMFRYN